MEHTEKCTFRAVIGLKADTHRKSDRYTQLKTDTRRITKDPQTEGGEGAIAKTDIHTATNVIAFTIMLSTQNHPCYRQKRVSIGFF